MAGDFAQIVKQQADIVRVIGEYVRLRKAGAQNYSGLCPFHSEKTPSFSVHAGKQFYHCFGCGQSGDVFSFLQKIENAGFREAVKIAAQKCGIALPKRDFTSPEEAKEHRERGKLLELHEKAAAWFEEQLGTPEGSRAREYLTGRGLSAEAIARFRIGYAPDSQGLRDYLKGFVNDSELLVLSGLCSSKPQLDGAPGPIYARFRKRITFPIRNESGRVIAFTARALDSGEAAGPKYLNSPETPLYSKGQTLFNLDRARQAIRQLDYAVLVEGQMDCITASMAGIENVIASSGTAFTEMQARLLGRYTKRLFVSFDPDAAGANAAERTISLLTGEDFEIKVVTLDSGLDPDRYIRERGVQEYVRAIKTGRRYSEHLIDRALQLYPGRTAESKSKAINYLLPYIRRAPNRIVREEFAADAAQKLGIDAAIVREELKQAALKRRERIVSKSAGDVSQAERVFLRALASSPGARAFEIARDALTGHAECFEGLAAGGILERLSTRMEGDFFSACDDPGERALLAGLLVQEQDEVTPEEIAAALASLEVRRLEARQRLLRAEIAEAERRGDWDQVTICAAEKLKIDREVRIAGASLAD